MRSAAGAKDSQASPAASTDTVAVERSAARDPGAAPVDAERVAAGRANREVLRRDDRGDDDVVDLPHLSPLPLDDRAQGQSVLVGGPLPDRRQPGRGDQRVPLEEAEDGVRVPDVEREEEPHARLRRT